jgi:hypothetical protein
MVDDTLGGRLHAEDAARPNCGCVFFRNDCQPGDGRTLRFSATNELFDLKQAAMSKLTDCNTGHPNQRNEQGCPSRSVKRWRWEFLRPTALAL